MARSVASARRGIPQVLAAALIWSTGGVAIKAVSEPPLKIAFYRSAIAAVALLLLLRPRLPRATAAFRIAVVSYAVCLTTFVVATRWTTAANAIFLQYSGVAWVLLLSPLLLKEPLGRRDAIAVAVAFAGMGLFFVGKFGRGGAGDVVALVSGVFFAALVLSLRREREGGAEAAVTFGNFLAAAALLPFVASDLAVTRRSAAILVFLGVFQIGVAYMLFVRGLKHVTATAASLASMLEPIANPIWVFLFLGERPGGFALVGGLVVMGAIAWRTLETAPVATVPPPD